MSEIQGNSAVVEQSTEKIERSATQGLDAGAVVSQRATGVLHLLGRRLTDYDNYALKTADDYLNHTDLTIFNLEDFGDGHKSVDQKDLLNRPFLITGFKFSKSKHDPTDKYVVVTGVTLDDSLKFRFSDNTKFGAKDQLLQFMLFWSQMLHDTGEYDQAVEKGLIGVDECYIPIKCKGFEATDLPYTEMVVDKETGEVTEKESSYTKYSLMMQPNS